jgi:hypothetical protein
VNFLGSLQGHRNFTSLDGVHAAIEEPKTPASSYCRLTVQTFAGGDKAKHLFTRIRFCPLVECQLRRRTLTFSLLKQKVTLFLLQLDRINALTGITLGHSMTPIAARISIKGFALWLDLAHFDIG